MAIFEDGPYRVARVKYHSKHAANRFTSHSLRLGIHAAKEVKESGPGYLREPSAVGLEKKTCQCM